MQLWWTDADRAELSAIAHQLVDAVFSHRAAGCQGCAAGVPPCPKVQKAIAVALEWRSTRVLLSRAKWERFRQDLFELELELEECAS
jgi:hypothetical protein